MIERLKKKNYKVFKFFIVIKLQKQNELKQ